MITQTQVYLTHLGDLLSTHQEHEKHSQNDAQTNQHEGNVHHHVLRNNDLVQLHGRRIVNDDALRRWWEGESRVQFSIKRRKIDTMLCYSAISCL